MEQLLTVRQLQELLRVDRVTIYRMLEAGALPGFKVGGQWRFSQGEIEAWLNSQRVDAGEPEDRAAGEPASEARRYLPLSCLEPIQSIFAEALGVMAVCLDAAGQPLFPASHINPFCAEILSTQAGRRLCTDSRLAACQPGAAGETRHCHAGLRVAAAPVEWDGRPLAHALAAGYVVGPSEWEALRERAASVAQGIGLDSGRLAGLAGTVHRIQKEDERRLLGLLSKMAGSFAEMGQQRALFLRRLRRIAEIASAE